jgi:hypothetical protein
MFEKFQERVVADQVSLQFSMLDHFFQCPRRMAYTRSCSPADLFAPYSIALHLGDNISLLSDFLLTNHKSMPLRTAVLYETHRTMDKKPRQQIIASLYADFGFKIQHPFDVIRCYESGWNRLCETISASVYANGVPIHGFPL